MIYIKLCLFRYIEYKFKYAIFYVYFKVSFFKFESNFPTKKRNVNNN